MLHIIRSAADFMALHNRRAINAGDVLEVAYEADLILDGELYGKAPGESQLLDVLAYRRDSMSYAAIDRYGDTEIYLFTHEADRNRQRFAEPYGSDASFRQVGGDFVLPWYYGAIWYDATAQELIRWEGEKRVGPHRQDSRYNTQRISLAGPQEPVYLKRGTPTLRLLCEAIGHPYDQDAGQLVAALAKFMSAAVFDGLYHQGTRGQIEAMIQRATGSVAPPQHHIQACTPTPTTTLIYPTFYTPPL